MFHSQAHTHTRIYLHVHSHTQWKNQRRALLWMYSFFDWKWSDSLENPSSFRLSVRGEEAKQKTNGEYITCFCWASICLAVAGNFQSALSSCWRRWKLERKKRMKMKNFNNGDIWLFLAFYFWKMVSEKISIFCSKFYLWICIDGVGMG